MGEGDAYTGRIIRKLHAFGFIHCAEIMKERGTDVYCSHLNLAGFDVGDWVEFEIDPPPAGGSDQKPRAKCVRPYVSGKKEEEALQVGEAKRRRIHGGAWVD